jgi:dynein heavy chain 1
MVLDVKLLNRTIILDPPLSEARAFWYKQLHNQVGIVCGLERVDLTRQAVSTDKTY